MSVNNKVARGVRKVNESIVQEGRALVLTEEQADKLDWRDIPVGSIRINTSAEGGGTWSVKLEGETDWVPGGIKNDGTINVIKDSKINIENFIIKELELSGSKREFTYYYGDKEEASQLRHGVILYKNKVGGYGEYMQYGIYPTWFECKKNLLIDDDSLEPNYKNTEKVGYVFSLETGDYAMYRNYLKVTIDNVLHRSVQTGGVKEVSETRFCLTEDSLESGMEISVEYVNGFRLGNPFPRHFINPNEPDNNAAEIGDFWLKPDGEINDEEELPDSIEDDGLIGWDKIRKSSRPTSLAGYGIKDLVSYQGHKHTKDDIVDFPLSLKMEGGHADTADRATSDGDGRDIVSTYATKDEINKFVKNGNADEIIMLKHEVENEKNVIALYVNDVRIELASY
jgi:hypothetical protein